MNAAEPAGVPQVRGIEITGFVPPRKVMAKAVNGTSGRPVNEAEATPQQYLLLLGGLRSLAKGDHASRSILDSYLLRAMALSGWAPALDECARCGAPGPHDTFVAQLGGIVCHDCAPVGSARVDASTSALLRALMAGEWDVVDGASPSSVGAASGLIAAYAQWHLERGIRSLEHVSAPSFDFDGGVR